MTKLRYGMVGGDLNAFIGGVHRNALRLDPRAELVAGCFNIDHKINQATADLYSLANDRVYDDFQAMATVESAREDGIDFVVITTPNREHYRMSKAFLEAGINVVCEKPLCFEVAEAHELQTLATEKGLLFGVTYTYTGYTMVRVMREMVQTGKIGQIINVEAEYAQDWLLDQVDDNADKNNQLSVWRMDPTYAGISNSVGDIGTHIEATVHYITDLKIKRLLATLNNFGQQLDLNANMLIEYENGVYGSYWCSQVAAGHLNGLVIRIFGSQGALEWVQEQPDAVRYTPRGQATQIISRGASYISEKAGDGSRLPVGHPEGLTMAFANIYRDILTALEAKKEGKPAGEQYFTDVTDGIAGVKFVHAVVESANQDACWVAIE